MSKTVSVNLSTHGYVSVHNLPRVEYDQFPGGEAEKHYPATEDCGEFWSKEYFVGDVKFLFYTDEAPGTCPVCGGEAERMTNWFRCHGECETTYQKAE